MDIELWWEFVGFCPVVGGKGRRWKVRDSWAGEAGGQPAITARVFTVADERGGCLVHKTLLDHLGGMGVRLNIRRWVGGNLRGNDGGVEAWGITAPGKPCIGGLIISRAMRIALTRTRRLRGASSRLVSQAYMLLRVDGPSIA